MIYMNLNISEHMFQIGSINFNHNFDILALVFDWIAGHPMAL